ncbi:hypothetical protein D3C72_2571230 [compost metagenome]
MRSLMLMRYRSAVTETASLGVQVAPRVKLRDFSSFSGSRPAILPTGPTAGVIEMSVGTPPTKSV